MIHIFFLGVPDIILRLVDVSTLTACINSAANFYIYLLNGEKFRIQWVNKVAKFYTNSTRSSCTRWVFYTAYLQNVARFFYKFHQIWSQNSLNLVTLDEILLGSKWFSRPLIYKMWPDFIQIPPDLVTKITNTGHTEWSFSRLLKIFHGHLTI